MMTCEEAIITYGPMMRRAIFNVRKFDDRDAFQDACLLCWRFWEGFRGDSERSTWMVTISRRAALQSIRRERVRRNEDLTSVFVNMTGPNEEHSHVVRLMMGTLKRQNLTAPTLRGIEALESGDCSNSLKTVRFRGRAVAQKWFTEGVCA